MEGMCDASSQRWEKALLRPSLGHRRICLLHDVEHQVSEDLPPITAPLAWTVGYEWALLPRAGQGLLVSYTADVCCLSYTGLMAGALLLGGFLEWSEYQCSFLHFY